MNISNKVKVHSDTLVSVVIPTKNRATIISDSIESVIHQTYTNFELLIVDDGSTDETEQIIAVFLKKDKRISFFINEGVGGNAARNTGIKNAKGKYIAFNDDDDIWMPDKLKKQVKLFESLPESYAMIFCAHDKINKENKITFPKNRDNLKIYPDLLRENFIGTPTIMIRKEITRINNNKLFDPDLNVFQDWEFALNVLEDYKIYFQNDILVEACSENALPRTTALSLKDKADALAYVFQKHITLYRNEKSISSQIYYRIALWKYKSGSFSNTSWIGRSLKNNPINLNAWRLLALSTVKNILKQLAQ